MTESVRERAEQSVARRFSRIMNASTSPYGTLTDPPVIAILSSIGLVSMLVALQLEASPLVVRALAAVMALPIAIAITVSIALRGARRRVVDWLTTLPFPVENLNALLNGVGDSLEITFTNTVPNSVELNALLDAVSDECFVTHGAGVSEAAGQSAYREKEKADYERVVEIRIGVVDSKRNPAATNYLRYQRVRKLLERTLVPLHERFPVGEVRVK